MAAARAKVVAARAAARRKAAVARAKVAAARAKVAAAKAKVAAARAKVSAYMLQEEFCTSPDTKYRGAGDPPGAARGAAHQPRRVRRQFDGQGARGGWRPSINSPFTRGQGARGEGGLRQSMGRGGSQYRSRRLPQHSPPTWRLPSRLLEASPPWYPWYPENIFSNPISIQRCHSILWLVAHELDKPAKIARECGNRPFRSHHQYQLCI